MNRPKLTITRRHATPPTPPQEVSPPVAIPPPSTVCERCGVYVIYPDRHQAWHRRTDAESSRWEQFRRLVLDVFQARGYITKDGNNTPTGGDA